MPNPSHFSWGSCSHGMHLALPRPSSSAAAGTYVQLTAEAARSASTLEGPLAPGDVGYVLEDTGSGDRPFLVQELVSGRLWWYPEGALCSISSESVAPELRSPPAPGEGCYVTLMHDYRGYSDAGRGPLSLFMRDEDAYGIVLMESGQRFRVRSCFTGKDWWFDNGAVRPVQMRYVPEALRARVRPWWGDYVALTHDHGEFGSAAEGPLEPGNLGVVVAITSDLSDAAGGLQVPRYLVRACHNGQCYRYQEGALHLVVPQLLHAPKIPPATGRHRRRKLAVKLQLLEPGAAAAACAADAGGGASDAAAGRAALPSGHIVTWPDGALQPVQRVVPGRTYLIAAKLSCKDDDLMLANLRVRSFDLYAPSGTPGHFTHLPPVDTISSQQQQGQQPGRCQPLVSLAVCNSGRADSGNSSTQQPRGAGTRAWYNPVDDQVLSWFLWDSSDTPLVLKPNKVTGVEFVWGVSFAGLEGQETKQHMLFLQTAEHAPPGAEAGQQQQQQLSSAYASFVSLPAAAAAAAQGSGLPGIASSNSSANSFVLPWLAGNASGRRGRRVAADSSSSDDDNDDADEEEEGDGGGSDEDAGSSELESEGHNDGENDEEEQQQEEEEAANEAAALSSRRDSNDGGGAGGFGDGGRSSSGSNADGRPPAAGDGSRGGSDGDAAGSAPPTPPAGASAAGAGVEAASAAGGGAQGAAGDSAAAAAPCDSAEGIDAGMPCNTAAAAAERSGGSSRPAGVASSSSFHAGDNTGSSSDRLPSTPDLGSTASAASSSSRPGSSPAVAPGSSRPGSSPAVAPGSSSSSSGGTRDAFYRSRQDQSAAHSSSSGGGSARGPAAAAAAASQPRRGIRPAAGVAGAACSSLVGGVSIAEVMRQMQLQAESRQPLWQEGTELAASLAAKAMAAAEEWQSHWPRPR